MNISHSMASIMPNAPGGAMRHAGGQHTMRDRIMQLRVQAREREMNIREREDRQIEALIDRIALINDSDKSVELRMANVEMIELRISQIHEARAEREMMAAEQEMLWTKMLLEEAAEQPERQNQNNQPQTAEEAEQARQRYNIEGLSRIAASQDNLAELKRTRASLTAEAGRLRRDIESTNSNTVKMGSSPGLDIVVGGQSGHSNPDDFRNRHLSALNRGIAGTTAAINSTIGTMNRESARLRDEQAGAADPAELQHEEEAQEYREVDVYI